MDSSQTKKNKNNKKKKEGGEKGEKQQQQQQQQQQQPTDEAVDVGGDESERRKKTECPDDAEEEENFNLNQTTTTTTTTPNSVNSKHESEKKDTDCNYNTSTTIDNNNKDDSSNDDDDDDDNDDDDDDLSMYDDDDDGDDRQLYGGKRNRPDFTTGAPPGSFEMYALNRRELEERKVKHHDIIRKILADFDIEEVKEKYRGEGIVRDFSHANRKFRLWLEKVMGNDKVQLSDRKWQELFRQKVMEDYEHKLKERERQLAEAEVQRIQRLRLQGIITSEDSREKTNGHRNSGRSKKKNHRSFDNHSAKHQDLYTRPLDDIETQMDIINKDNNNNNNNNNNTRARDSRTPSALDDRRDRKERETSEDDTNRRNYGTMTSLEDERSSLQNGDRSDFDKENDRSSSSNGHLGMSGTIRPARNQDTQCLYKEEDLHQLYVRADQMIRPSDSASYSCK